jgi:NADH-quinone oxidoreductase subunit J
MNPSTGEQVAFWTLSLLAIASCVFMLFSRKAVHAALWVATAMICLAGLYVMEGAFFLGVVQVVVYTGAIMMLFLFVLMLVGVDASDSLVETIRGQRVAAIVMGAGFGALLLALISRTTLGEPIGVGEVNDAAGGNLQAIAALIFGRYVWAFEVIGAVLIVAAVGAMVLAHRERLEPKQNQRALSEIRFKSADPSPLPPAGVFARHNAVDTPALLPDGSVATTSISPVIAGATEGRAFDTESAAALEERLSRGEDA